MATSSYRRMLIPFLLLNGFLQISAQTASPRSNVTGGTNDACESINNSYWPVDCSLRAFMITPNSQNQTVLTTTIYNTVYNTSTANTTVWTFGRRMGFNSYWNSIRNIIWSTTTYSTMESKISNIVAVLNAYSRNNCTLQADLFKAELITSEGECTWGSVGAFVKCRNITRMEPTTTTIKTTTTTPTTTNACKTMGNVESRSLEQIYQAALAEGNGTMVVYSGGTARGQQAATKQAFEQRFPGLTVDIVVDYSHYQGPRIDVQLANNSLVPDVVQLQTLQAFPRWKEQGHLLQYKPANWSQVYEEFKDPDGYYTANMVLLLITVVNSAQVPEANWPRTAQDFLRTEFSNGQMVIVHPNMDDIVLFYFKQLVDIYGYEFLAQFAAQQPTYLCEGFPQLMAMGFAGANATHLVAPAGIAAIAFDNSSIPQFAFPADNDPFATYAMYAAIFQQAKRPETAKLYVNWLLERESPNNQGNIWSVRRDMTPLQGFRPVVEYTNSNHSAFLAFMEDYEQREHFSRQIDLFFGASTCDTAPLEPSLASTSQ